MYAVQEGSGSGARLCSANMLIPDSAHAVLLSSPPLLINSCCARYAVTRREVWRAYAVQEGTGTGEYVRFANMLISDAIYLLDESLKKLQEVGVRVSRFYGSRIRSIVGGSCLWSFRLGVKKSVCVEKGDLHHLCCI